MGSVSRLPLLLLFGLVAGDYLFGARVNIDNQWIAMTGPWCENHEANPIVGYAWAATKGGLIHNENFSVFADQAMLAGQAQNKAFYALRPGLGLLAHLLFFLPVWAATKVAIGAMALVAAGSMYFIGRRYALPPVLCALLGASAYLLGSVSFHLADFSAHIAGPATWILASFVVLVLRPWDRDADWRKFLLAHLTFWVVVPFYWSNIVLYCALALMFLFQLRRLAISIVLLVGCYFWRDAWAFVMNAAFGGSVPYALTESLYMARAINAWREGFQSGGLLHVARLVLQYASEAVSPEPVVSVVAVGISVAVALRSKSFAALWQDKFLIFTVLSGLGACAIVVVWGPSAGARGYLAYGVPIALVISMTVLIGRAGLSRTGLRWVAASMVVLVCLQIVWVKGLMLGNPVPICQYFLAAYDWGFVPALVESFTSPLTFAPFGMELKPHGWSQMNNVVSAALAELTSALQPSTFAAVDTSRRLLPSLALGAVLLLPLAAALIVKRKKPALVTLSVASLWIAAWIAAPSVRKDGLTYYKLDGACPEGGHARRYAITIPAGLGSALDRYKIDQVELLGGFSRFYLGGMVSVDVSSNDEAAPKSITSNAGRFAVEKFKEVLPRDGSAASISLSENFKVMPVQYQGWRLASGFEGCPDAVIAPFVELRGYRDGRPVLIMY